MSGDERGQAGEAHTIYIEHISNDPPPAVEKWRDVVSAPQPIPDDELAAIKARARDASATIYAGDLAMIQRGAAARLAREDVPAMVAEVERLRARVATLTTELDDTAAELIGMDG